MKSKTIFLFSIFLLFTIILSSVTVEASFKREVYDYQGSNLRQQVNYSIMDPRNFTGDTMNLTGNLSASTGFFSFLGSLTDRITKLFIINIDVRESIIFPSMMIKNVTTNDAVNGTAYGFYMNGQTGVNMPHLWISPGGPGQASGISRSVMIVNEIVASQNTTNITDCAANGVVNIDCNSSTTGADLFVGDDLEVAGDVWLKNTEGEWRFFTRVLELLDETFENILFNDASLSISSGVLNINETKNQTLVVNINRTETIFSTNSDSISLNTGTNTTRAINHIYYYGENDDN